MYLSVSAQQADDYYVRMPLPTLEGFLLTLELRQTRLIVSSKEPYPFYEIGQEIWRETTSSPNGT